MHDGYILSKSIIPMPFLFGGLFSTSVIVMSNKFSQFDSYQFPPNFRLIFLSIIGVMIGGTLNQEILRTFEYLWVSISAIAIFVLIAHLANYLIFLYSKPNLYIKTLYSYQMLIRLDLCNE